MARGPRSPRLSRVALYRGVDEPEDPSTTDACTQRKVEGAREWIFASNPRRRRRDESGGGPKGKVGGGRASSSIGRSSRAAGLFPVGGRSGSAAGLLPFGGVSGPAAPLFPISGGNGEHQHRPHPWLHPARPNPPLSAASLATAGASLIISRCF